MCRAMFRILRALTDLPRLLRIPKDYFLLTDFWQDVETRVLLFHLIITQLPPAHSSFIAFHS